MQATAPQTSPASKDTLSRKLGYFLIPPIVALVVLALLIAAVVNSYQAQHDGRIFTGVYVDRINLSGLKPDEARAALDEAFPYPQQGEIVLTDSLTGKQWKFTPGELGMGYDLDQTITEAFDVGRSGSPLERMSAMFQSWYYGRYLSPIIVYDEGKLVEAVDSVGTAVNESAVDANIFYDGERVDYATGQPGRVLDKPHLQAELETALIEFRSADIELLVHDIYPALFEDEEVAAQLDQIMSGPMTLYLPEPLDENDLQPVELSLEELAGWLRVDVVEDENGELHHEVLVDENALRHWLRQYETALYRDPVGARFYFNDDTRELVLVAPHVNGRSLNLDATAERFMQQLATPNRAAPFVVDEIVPTVSSDATAVELGVTELITETTTWFRGSSDARKHNIARAAANFFGIVIAPGEEFSFNKYLGRISEADGYEEGLIIVGGRTIKGIGGGVCQVSTTLYQAAFMGGYPITERWPHGYMLGYYNDGQGPGMDATVFSPIVDLKFINNTPHHLLIENYYNEEFEALTFKFYSTSMGRQVVKSEPVFENVRPAPAAPAEDIWELDEDLEPGTVTQIDWATEGADVSVQRTVYNADGEVIIDETVISNYIPYPNVYHYGPGVEPYDYSLVPPNS